jgi:hypothetical protein
MIQVLSAVQPMNTDTALAESERAGGGEEQQVPHLWLMWGSDQDDRSFLGRHLSKSRRDVSIRRR